MAEAGRVIRLAWGPTALAFIEAAASGRTADGRAVDEVAIVGSRGEGKSWACLGVTLRHAQLHEAAGYPLPVPWLWFRDAFPNHQRNLLEDIRRPEWQGLWQQHDGGRVVVAEMRGHPIVRAWVIGLEDMQAVERLRGQAVGIYGEEPAPVIAASTSTGWTEKAWETALMSQGRGERRSHSYPAIIASNPSQRSHWFWRRFVLDPTPHRACYRIPVGERTSAEYRDRLARTITSPDLRARLVEGEASVVSLGDPVVACYRTSIHRSSRQLDVAPGPLYFGWDAWHHPACVIASLSPMGQLRIHYARRLDGADVGTLADEYVRPWLASRRLLDRPRVHTGDPTMDTGDQSDRDQTATQRVLRSLPGDWQPSTNDIGVLRIALNDALKRRLSTGEPAVILDPEADELDEAWAGGWFLNEQGRPVQHGQQGQHSHVGMAGAYLVRSVLATWEPAETRPRPTHARCAWDAHEWPGQRRQYARSSL